MQQRKQYILIVQIWVGVMLVLGGCQWWRTHADSSYIANRCQRRIRNSADPAELQAWAEDLLRRYPPDTTNYSGPLAPPHGLEDVWSHPPSVVLIASSPAHEAHVRLLWGSGVLGHWGLWLGSTNLVAAGNCERWQSGVYFWKDFDR
jgi:hypothetical protein